MRNLSGTVYFRGFVVFCRSRLPVSDKMALPRWLSTCGVEKSTVVGATSESYFWLGPGRIWAHIQKIPLFLQSLTEMTSIVLGWHMFFPMDRMSLLHCVCTSVLTLIPGHSSFSLLSFYLPPPRTPSSGGHKPCFWSSLHNSVGLHAIPYTGGAPYTWLN